MNDKNYHTFLSHNNADKPAIEILAHRLRKEGIELWLDVWNLVPGEPWQPAIEKALMACETCAVFIGSSGIGPWQNEEMRAAINRRASLTKGSFRVIPVLLPGAQRPDRSALPSFLVTTTWVEFRKSLGDEDALKRLICGIRGTEPGPGPEQSTYEGACPYRGLQFFDTEHAPFFFGRESTTEWLVDKIRRKPGNSRDNRFLGIIGASGVGKSSLVRAGLISALERGALSGSDQWPIIVCRPGNDPLESLAVALADNSQIKEKIESTRTLMSDLLSEERTLHLTTREALHHKPETCYVIVLVDQFEEVFSLCQEESLRSAFIDNLSYAASAAQGRTIVVVTLRADFYGDCGNYDMLSRALSDHQTLVGNLAEHELRMAIERPAQLVGCELEGGLVEILIRDVQNQAGALPLLQYALTELWERRIGSSLTLDAYKSIGRLEGALEKRADEIFEALGEDKRAICRRIFLRLAQISQDDKYTKRRASFLELLPAEGSEAPVHEVTQSLAAARLITTEGDIDQLANRYVEVAHEALIHHWGLLSGWLKEERDFLLWRQRLEAHLEEWHHTGQEKGALLSGAPLIEADRWLAKRANDIVPREQEFLKCSRRRRIYTRSLAVGGLVTIFALGLGIVKMAIDGRIRDQVDKQLWFLDNSYPKKLYDYQKQISTLHLQGRVNLNRLPWHPSDRVHELSLRAEGGEINGISQLARCDGLETLILDLTDGQTHSLQPLEKLSGLRHLILKLNEISLEDVQSLERLNESTQIGLVLKPSDVSELARLVSLTRLTQLSLNLIAYNSGNDIQPLADIPNLSELTLRLNGTTISELKILKELRGLKLLTLHLSRSKVVDLSVLESPSDVNQLTLDVRRSRINDLSPLTNLAGLDQLTLRLDASDEQFIQPLTKLESLTRLTLDLSQSDLNDLSFLEQLLKLRRLVLVLGPHNLKTLKLPEKFINSVESILRFQPAGEDELATFVDLPEFSGLILDLDTSTIGDLSSLKNLTKLTQLTLELKNSAIEDLSPLKALPNLKMLRIEIEDDKRGRLLRHLSEIPKSVTHLEF